MTPMPTEPAATTPIPTLNEVQFDTPIPTPTDTPEITKAPEPTDMPMPTLTSGPSPTSTSAPTPEPTLTPEPSKVPTVAPEVTKAPLGKPTPTPLVEYKKDGVDVPIVQTFQVSDTTYIYVYENGHVGIADTATGYTAKYGTGFGNPSNIDVTTVIAKVRNALEKNNVAVEPQYLPTPTPTPIPPTPFPTPNPEKPKMLASYKGDKEYGDITVEAWDNGYLYVKGTGVYYVKSTMSYTPQDLEDYWKIGRASGYTYSHLVIEEGITELKDSPCWANNSISDREMLKYIEIPSTLNKMDKDSFYANHLNDITVTGYKNGEKVTFTVKAGERLTDAIAVNLDITVY